MKKSIDIVKIHLVPKLEKVYNFDINKLPDFFWAEFTESLLTFETNAKPIYKLIFGLELDPEITEKIISKIPDVFSKLVKELAEEYVNGSSSKAISVLLNSKGQVFKTEVEFFYVLNKAIQITERKRLKAEIPFFFEMLKNKILDSENNQNDKD
jgi:phage-related holin